MAITIQHDYTPGTSARGDFVEDDFNNIIAFVNTLEATKLSTSGGTVNSLIISGTLLTQGLATFEAGITVNNVLGTFTAGIAVSGAPSIFTAKLQTTLDPSDPNDVVKLDWYENDRDTVLGGFLKKDNTGFEYQKITASNISLQTGATIEAFNTAGTPASTQRRGMFASKLGYSILNGLPDEFLAFIENPVSPESGNNEFTWFGLNDLKMVGGANQTDEMQLTNLEIAFNDVNGDDHVKMNPINGFVAEKTDTVGSLSHNTLNIANTNLVKSFNVDVGSDVIIKIVGLPTSAGATGELWNDSGTIKMA